MTLARGELLTPSPLHRAWGERRLEKIAAPGANKQWEWPVPAGFSARVLSIMETLTVGEALKEAFPCIEFMRGGVDLIGISGGNFGVKAGAVSPVAFQINYQGPVTATNRRQVTWIPDLILKQGDTVVSVTPGMEGTDAYSAISLWVELFPRDGRDIVTEHAALLSRVEHLERMIEHGQAIHA